MLINKRPPRVHMKQHCGGPEQHVIQLVLPERIHTENYGIWQHSTSYRGSFRQGLEAGHQKTLKIERRHSTFESTKSKRYDKIRRNIRCAAHRHPNERPVRKLQVSLADYFTSDCNAASASSKLKPAIERSIKAFTSGRQRLPILPSCV